ncbi:carbohydrate ABC transporter permease [Clostridium sp. YIM B02515]|uniref:Carbohydrate ABC transporter permease n=1 Tax=Clostridium rhizosphaerae TaxID=2803861 RepID=A0ABS1T5K9_9CLOT|nr:carbohydrate ABC transporter permease [Clostridium rhizosphaerae]MBL4934620.1 carbohydrate ABC transporter permease [Clostridium rhizosphaerae]
MRSLKSRKKFSIANVIINLVFIIACIFCILPLLLVLSVSLSNENSIYKNGYHLIPQVFSFKAYEFIFSGNSPVLNAYLITTIVTVVGTFIHLYITSMLAYGLSRKEVKYNKGLSFFVFFCLLFSGGMLPWYILITKYLHMKDTIIVLIFPYLVSSVNVLIMKNFFKGVPNSIIEAARIDGSSEYNTFLKIIMPISKPVFATIGLFVAVFYWNDWMTCSLFINNNKLYDLQFLLQSIMNNIAYLQGNPMLEKVGTNLPDETARMATCILAIAPIIIAYPFIQKYFEKGLTIGAVKE